MSALFQLVTVHCFWSPRCTHVVSDVDSRAASAAMEAHYEAEHQRDIDKIIFGETGARKRAAA